jgi:hypothetical protein
MQPISSGGVKMSQFTYGLEFEVTQINPATASRALTQGGITCHEASPHGLSTDWTAVHDGSVRGAEVVSPILNDARLNEASTVARLLLGAGASVDRTTGFHVHLGFDSFGESFDERLNTLANFYINWHTAHETIGTLVAPSRLNNRFCKVRTIAEATVTAERIRGGHIGIGDRYVSLNLESFDRHGTIEVRLHQGTLNGRKAVAWAEFIAGLVDYSRANNTLGATYSRTDIRLNNIENLLDELSQDHLDVRTADFLKRRALNLQGQA